MLEAIIAWLIGAALSGCMIAIGYHVHKVAGAWPASLPVGSPIWRRAEVQVLWWGWLVQRGTALTMWLIGGYMFWVLCITAWYPGPR